MIAIVIEFTKLFSKLIGTSLLTPQALRGRRVRVSLIGRSF
jgi:hypothetical protein